MSESEAEHVRQHVRVYLMVFAALGVLTIITVAISYLDLPTSMISEARKIQIPSFPLVTPVSGCGSAW